MSPESISDTPGKKIPLYDYVRIPTLNIGDSVTISASTPFNWDGDLTYFSFYTKEDGDIPIAVGFRPGDQGRDNDEGKRGRLSLNATYAHSGFPPWNDMAWLSDLFIEGEHAWFTIKNQDDTFYALTFPTGKNIYFIKQDRLKAPVNFVKYLWFVYPPGPSAFSDAVIQ